MESLKKTTISFCVIAGFIFFAASVVTAGKSSIDLGRNLFNDPTLGGSSNATSCNSCHLNGRGLEHAGSNPKLSKTINKCITGHMAGNKIDGRTVPMRSLKMFIESLGSN